MNPNINYGLWVLMTCQCRLIDYNKVPLWWDIDKGGDCAYVGVGAYGKFLYLLFILL